MTGAGAGGGAAGARRQLIEVPGVTHGSMPIPMAVRIDRMVYSSGIHGLDPDTGELPEDAARQIELVFRHMRTIVTAAGGTVDDIAQVVFNLADDEYRPLVNAAWLDMFPDGNWPARNTVIMSLGYGMVIHVLMTAVLPA